MRTKLQRERGTIQPNANACRVFSEQRQRKTAVRELYFNNLSDEVEEGLSRNDLRPAYAAVRRMPYRSGKRTEVLASCNSYEEMLSRWTEHYSEALSHPAASPCPELDAQSLHAVDDPEIPYMR